MGQTMATGVGMFIASVISSTLTFGTYGYLKDKKKWSSWKAGAGVGAISGMVGIAAFLAMNAIQSRYAPATGRLGASLPNVRLRQRYPAAYKSHKSIGMLVAERLGCSSCGA